MYVLLILTGFYVLCITYLFGEVVYISRIYSLDTDMYLHIRHIKIPSPYAWWNYVDECGLMQAYWAAWRLLWPGAATWGGGSSARAHKTGKVRHNSLCTVNKFFIKMLVRTEGDQANLLFNNYLFQFLLWVFFQNLYKTFWQCRREIFGNFV